MPALLRLLAQSFCFVLLLFSLTGCQSSSEQMAPKQAPNLPTAENTINPMAFTVIGKVPTAQIRTLLPQVLQQPVVLVFKSKYCHDCQRMAPELNGVMAQHKGVQSMVIDVQYDKATHGAVLRAFKPTVIPIVVAIHRGGDLSNVLVGYHNAQAIAALYQAIDLIPSSL